MADDKGDPSRWSHSTGEAQEFQERIAATQSTRSSAYSGTVEEIGIGISINPIDASLAISSGDNTKKKREKAKAVRERVKKEAAEKEKAEKEKAEKEKAEKEKAEREKAERERENERTE
ncbi:uncharacterized protein E0L32_004981 [Thyridium curvatum]|uniref:Uncharacterized protein n=1 Tax=Thyridium curvatum TaxID=1093900 RepID=A0A507AY27_9PEZI|nr:uncharacterized protein E0L32_004981 [Thyridium curvatum]TPX14872.1 hypothetical protein E0L32_004981 [Thyridium curvatum]